MKIVLAVLQFLLFLAVFFVGSVILTGLRLIPEEVVSFGPHRVWVFDGALMMLLVYLFILAIEAARKRLNSSAGLTTAAFVLAFIVGLFLMKFGLKTI